MTGEKFAYLRQHQLKRSSFGSTLRKRKGIRMVKLVFFLHKHPDLTEEAFRRYWSDTHGPLVAKIPGLRKYVLGQHVPVALPFPPPCDGLAELWFDSVESMQNALSSPEGQAAIADAASCFDVARTSMIVVEESPML
jgi:uncharacterized protein (TIGR02118 family)